MKWMDSLLILVSERLAEIVLVIGYYSLQRYQAVECLLLTHILYGLLFGLQHKETVEKQETIDSVLTAYNNYMLIQNRKCREMGVQAAAPETLRGKE